MSEFYLPVIYNIHITQTARIIFTQNPSGILVCKSVIFTVKAKHDCLEYNHIYIIHKNNAAHTQQAYRYTLTLKRKRERED